MLDTVTDKKTNETDAPTLFSAERTFLAWIRTGLSMMGFGFVVARFGLFLREMQAMGSDTKVQTHSISMWTGVALVALGVIVNLVSAWQHWQITRRLLRREPLRFSPITLGTVVAVVLALMGATLIGYLIYEVQSAPPPKGTIQPKPTQVNILQPHSIQEDSSSTFRMRDSVPANQELAEFKSDA